MPRLTIKPEDILRGKKVEPTWYRCKVVKAEETTASTGVAGTLIDLEIIKACQSQSTKFAGVPLQVRFWENAPGFAVGFVEAFGGKIDETKGVTVEFADTVGKEVDVYVKNDLYKGRGVNVAEDFRQAR